MMLEIIHRKEAKELRLKTYFTGKPCKHNHVGERQVNGRKCIECLKIYSPQYRKEHKEETKNYNAQYNKDHKKEIAEYLQDHKEERAQYRAEHKKEKAQYGARYYQNRKEEIAHKHSQYYQYHKEEIAHKHAQYYQDHKEDIKRQIALYAKSHKKEIVEYRQKKQKTNINVRLACSLRSRLCVAIRNNQKAGSAVRDLGCSIPELKQHLETQFQPRMSWDNWSRDGWHIDHIKPLSSFDLTNREQFLEANHYTNLQPLWATENLSKGNKILKEAA